MSETEDKNIDEALKMMLEEGLFYKIEVTMKGMKEVPSHEPPHPIWGARTATRFYTLDLQGLYAKYDKANDVLIITKPKISSMEVNVK